MGDLEARPIAFVGSDATEATKDGTTAVRLHHKQRARISWRADQHGCIVCQGSVAVGVDGLIDAAIVRGSSSTVQIEGIVCVGLQSANSPSRRARKAQRRDVENEFLSSS